MFPQPPCSPNQSYFLDSGLDEGMRTEVASREGSSAFIKAHTDGACVLRRLGSWHCEKVPMLSWKGTKGHLPLRDHRMHEQSDSKSENPSHLPLLAIIWAR